MNDNLRYQQRDLSERPLWIGVGIICLLFTIPLCCACTQTKPYVHAELRCDEVTPPNVDMSGSFATGAFSSRDNDCVAISVAGLGMFYQHVTIRPEEISMMGRVWPGIALSEGQAKGWYKSWKKIKKEEICGYLDAGIPVMVTVKLPEGNHCCLLVGRGFMYYIVRDNSPRPGKWLASSPEWNDAMGEAWIASN